MSVTELIRELLRHTKQGIRRAEGRKKQRKGWKKKENSKGSWWVDHQVESTMENEKEKSDERMMGREEGMKNYLVTGAILYSSSDKV